MTKTKYTVNNMILLKFTETIRLRLEEPQPLIQVILGPRQVGKTTAIHQITAALPESVRFHYASADAVFRSDWSWIEQQWTTAKSMGVSTILILDEIQKIDNWSETIKKLWDVDKRGQDRIKVVLLGSNSR
jgi:predicted AAA+ superfamily ATPase